MKSLTWRGNYAVVVLLAIFSLPPWWTSVNKNTGINTVTFNIHFLWRHLWCLTCKEPCCHRNSRYHHFDTDREGAWLVVVLTLKEKRAITGQHISEGSKIPTEIPSDGNNEGMFYWKDKRILSKPFPTSITFGFTPRYKLGALRAGAGVPSRSEQTQMAADSLTWILHYTSTENSETRNT